jgi:transposase-like protein
VELLRSERGADLVRESLGWLVRELIEAEVSELIGARLGERTEDRATHRWPHRPRRLRDLASAVCVITQNG